MPLAKNIVSIFTVNVLLALFISFDIIAARHYFAPELSGLYSGASTLSNAIVFVCLPLIGVLLANLNANSLKDSKNVLTKTSAMVLVVMVGSVAVLKLIPTPLLSIFGQKYTVMGYLLWRMGILMSLVAGMSLTLQVGAFYRPLRTAVICLLGLLTLILAVMARHSAPLSFVSTIMAVFATILVSSSLQLIWIYSRGNQA